MLDRVTSLPKTLQEYPRLLTVKGLEDWDSHEVELLGVESKLSRTRTREIKGKRSRDKSGGGKGARRSQKTNCDIS